MYIAGTLRKWTNYFNGWQERWFVLDKGILSYYKSQDDVNNGCKGSVKMSVCDIIVHSTDQTRLDLIIPGEQHFYVKAANPQERQEWLVALGTAKASMGKLSEESDDSAHDLLKSKRSELRLYCDLLMQQIHSVKTAVEEQETPNVEKLNEATSLISPTCDTFINTLNECMRIAHTSLTFEGQHPVIVDATAPSSPLKGPSKKGKHIHRQNSSERSFHSHSRSPSVSSTETTPPSRQNSYGPATSDISTSDLNLTDQSYHGTKQIDSGHVTSGPKINGLSSQPSKPNVQSYKSDLKSIKEMVHSNKTSSVISSRNQNVNNSHRTDPVPRETGLVNPKSQTGLVSVDSTQADEDVFLDPMQERIPTFFSELESSFLDLPIGEDGCIPVQPFLDSCRCLVPIFDKLNATAFAPVKLDFKGNIQKVHTKYTSNPVEFPNLQRMMSHEVFLKQSHLPHSACMALLWMKRSLEFIIGFMEEVKNGEENLSVAATNSYSKSLKPFHGWVVRGVFAVAVKALPYRKTFISLLHGPSTQNPGEVDEDLFINCLMQDIEAFNAALHVIVKILNDFFKEKGLNSDEQI